MELEKYSQDGTIDACLCYLKDTYDKKDEEIKRLRSRLQALTDDYSKDEDIKQMKEKLEQMRKDCFRGFPISEKEQEQIDEWKQSHMKKKHWDKVNHCVCGSGAIGGRFTYEFVPTSIGVIGTIVCDCGESFTFKDL